MYIKRNVLKKTFQEHPTRGIHSGSHPALRAGCALLPPARISTAGTADQRVSAACSGQQRVITDFCNCNAGFQQVKANKDICGI